MSKTNNTITLAINIDTILEKVGLTVEKMKNEYGYEKCIIYARPFIVEAIRAKYNQFIRPVTENKNHKPTLFGCPIEPKEFSGDELVVVKEDTDPITMKEENKNG